MALFDFVKRAMRGGADELTRDDLLRLTTEGVLGLMTWGARGAEVFPPAVVVRVQVAEGAVGVVREMVEEPAFEQEVEARLLNRLSNPDRSKLPLRRYEVEAAQQNTLTVQPDEAAAVVALRVEGGDKDGERYALPVSQREFRLGRGPWHGRDRRAPNDLSVTEEAPFVSRAAAILRRVGVHLEVESCDQGEYLVVARADGSRVRPEMTAMGRVVLKAGDALELNDGGQQKISLWLEEP